MQKMNKLKCSGCGIIRGSMKELVDHAAYCTGKNQNETMGKEMNKIFRYKKYKFNIKVELHTKAERHSGGKVWNKVTINDMGAGNWYKKEEVVTDETVQQIDRFQFAAMDYVDKRDTRPEIEKRLSDMGFK